MIGIPNGWARRPSGRGVLLVPPGGAARGGIRYDERVTPLAPLSALLEKHVADDAFAVARVGAWERLTTLEGEHAAVITIAGTLDGRLAQRDLGVVLLDDSYASVSGYCLDPNAFAGFTAMVRELTAGDTHFLGVRRRRYEYDAPAGWQARALGFDAEWFPVDYPRATSSITVWAALPRQQVSASQLFERARTEEPAARVYGDPHPIMSAHGLSGHELVLDHARGTGRHVVVLEDDRFVYPLRFETTSPEAGADAALWRAVVESVRPVPRVKGDFAPLVHSLDHWVE